MKSNSKTILFVVLIALVIFTRFFYKTIPHKSSASIATTTSQPGTQSSPTSSSALAAGGEHQSIIDPNVNLIYTKHARCRMECRHISEADIREVLREGHVNEAKSKQEPGKCPAYAIEDNRNSDGIRLRIVFAQCDYEVKVVTCIDRDDDFACDCK